MEYAAFGKTMVNARKHRYKTCENRQNKNLLAIEIIKKKEYLLINLSI